MGCFRIFDSNFIDLDILANSDVSSEQAAFPVTNAYNDKRRSKVWRSNGYYEVTSLNNGIVFNEGASNLVATIPTGNYLRSDFLVAVKAALELVGANTYTVTFGSMFKFMLASSGMTFSLIGTDAGFTATTLLGLDIVDYTGATSYTADSLVIHTSEWILWDMGIASNPKAFMMIDARNSPLPISPTAVVRLQGNHTNNFTNPVYSQDLAYDDRLLHVFDDAGLATEAVRYWRLQFLDPTNPNGFIQVGAFFLGTYWDAIQGAPQFPLKESEIDRTDIVYSEGGEEFAEIKPKTESFSTSWFGLNITDKEALQEIFDKFGKGIAFFISMDTMVAFSSSQSYEIKYVKFSDEPSFELTRPKIFKVDLNFEEQL